MHEPSRRRAFWTTLEVSPGMMRDRDQQATKKRKYRDGAKRNQRHLEVVERQGDLLSENELQEDLV